MLDSNPKTIAYDLRSYRLDAVSLALTSSCDSAASAYFDFDTHLRFLAYVAIGYKLDTAEFHWKEPSAFITVLLAAVTFSVFETEISRTLQVISSLLLKTTP